ncbi:MAG: hypothetical protein ACRDBG_25360, partial [Waterburya sp.]
VHQEKDEEAKALRLGGALDCLLTDPSRFDEDFIVMSYERPFGKLGAFAKELPEGLSPQSDLSLYEEAWKKADYMRDLTWCVDNFWKSKEAVEYYKLRNNTKIVLSYSEIEAVKDARDRLLSSPLTGNYFLKNSSVEIELLHQVPIYFDYKGAECKALLDGIKIDHKNKIIKPFDLKSTSKSIYTFETSYIEWGYYRQSAFYNYALQMPESPVFELIEKGYTIEKFKFIVVQLYSKVTPLIFTVNEQGLRCGLSGGYDKKGVYHKGIDQLLDAYYFHQKHNDYRHPVEILEAGEIVELNVFI